MTFCFAGEKFPSSHPGDFGSSSSLARIYGTWLLRPLRPHLWDLVLRNRGPGGKGSSLQDATWCRLRLLQHFCRLSLRHRENAIAVTTPPQFQVGFGRWQKSLVVVFSVCFFFVVDSLIQLLIAVDLKKWTVSSWKNEETQASLPWLWVISAVNQWNHSNLWKPSMPNCEALLTGAGSWRSLCTSKLVVSRCFSSALVPSLKTTCGVCCLWMLQWIILWRFTGRLHGRLNFLPLQHGQDLGAVQAGRFSPRWKKNNPRKTHIPGWYGGGLLVNPSLIILKRSKCTVYSLHVLHIDMTGIF